MYACNKIPLLFLITWVKVKWNLGAFCVTWRDFTHGRSLVRSSRPPDSLTPQIIMSDSPWRSPRSARCASPARHESPLRGTPWSRTAPRAAWSDCQWTPSSPGTCEATAGAPPRAAGIRCKPPEAAYLGGRTRNAFSEERIRQNRSMNITANTSWLWLNPKNKKSFPFKKKSLKVLVKK